MVDANAKISTPKKPDYRNSARSHPITNSVILYFKNNYKFLY